MQQTSYFEYELPTWYKKYNASGIDFDIPDPAKKPPKASAAENSKNKIQKDKNEVHDKR
jgi:hypothetical protein